MHMTLPEKLEDLAQQMRNGDYTKSNSAILLTRDKETGMVTIVPWGEDTGLIKEAYRLKHAN